MMDIYDYSLICLTLPMNSQELSRLVDRDNIQMDSVIMKIKKKTRAKAKRPVCSTSHSVNDVECYLEP